MSRALLARQRGQGWRTLMVMRLFGAVRLFSVLELALFCALLFVWLGHLDRGAQFVLGLAHGIGVICLCAVIYIGCLRRVFPWPLLAATVLLGPVGSTVGIEAMKRRPVA